MTLSALQGSPYEKRLCLVSKDFSTFNEKDELEEE